MPPTTPTRAPVRRRGGGRGGEAGSATIWVLAFALLATTVAGLVVARTSAVLARHRAESAADLAALAGAAAIGTGQDPCSRARGLASANGASLGACRAVLAIDGRSGTVDVQVTRSVGLPLVPGTRTVSASARAGRLPSGKRATGAP